MEISSWSAIFSSLRLMFELLSSTVLIHSHLNLQAPVPIINISDDSDDDELNIDGNLLDGSDLVSLLYTLPLFPLSVKAELVRPSLYVTAFLDLSEIQTSFQEEERVRLVPVVGHRQDLRSGGLAELGEDVCCMQS